MKLLDTHSRIVGDFTASYFPPGLEIPCQVTGGGERQRSDPLWLAVHSRKGDSRIVSPVDQPSPSVIGTLNPNFFDSAPPAEVQKQLARLLHLSPCEPVARVRELHGEPVSPVNSQESPSMSEVGGKAVSRPKP